MVNDGSSTAFRGRSGGMATMVYILVWEYRFLSTRFHDRLAEHGRQDALLVLGVECCNGSIHFSSSEKTPAHGLDRMQASLVNARFWECLLAVIYVDWTETHHCPFAEF